MEHLPIFHHSPRHLGARTSPEGGGTSSLFRLSILAIAGVCAFLNLYAAQPLLPTLAQVFQAGPGASA